MIEVNVGSSVQNDSDEMVVSRARKRVAAMKDFRWFMLAFGLSFLTVAVYFTVKAVKWLGTSDEGQLTMGFVYGLALGIASVAFGLLAGLCIGKFLIGCHRDYREQELLVRYHDRLRELETGAENR